MNMYYIDPNLYITCILCNVNQNISGFRLKHFKCRLFIYLHRYRYTPTKYRFKGFAERFSLKV